MEVLNMEQGTQEWHEARRCTITGTKLKAVMGTREAQTTLIAELIAEKGTELTKEFRQSVEMERGSAEEDFAVKKFEAETKMTVDRIGMCRHKTLDWVALSPDGLIKDENGKYTEAVEIKCPDSKKIILSKIHNIVDPKETGLMGARGPKAGTPFLGIPSEYKWQVVHYFLVNPDLEKLYFVTYDERFIDEGAKLYTVEVLREQDELALAIKEAETELLAFRKRWMEWEELVLPSNF